MPYREPHPDVSEVRTRLAKAYRSLRKLGYVCKMDWKCCMGCGNEAMPPGTKKCIFFHRQDRDDLREHGTVHLAWSGDAKEIRTALENAGLSVTWNDSVKERPEVGIPRAA